MLFCSPLCIWSLPSGRTGTAPERRAARGRCAAPWRAKKKICVRRRTWAEGGVEKSLRCCATGAAFYGTAKFCYDQVTCHPVTHTTRAHTHAFSPPSSKRLRGCDESEDGQAKVETKRGRLNSWSPKMQHESDVIVPQIISEVDSDGWMHYIIVLVKLGTGSCKEKQLDMKERGHLCCSVYHTCIKRNFWWYDAQDLHFFSCELLLPLILFVLCSSNKPK